MIQLLAALAMTNLDADQFKAWGVETLEQAFFALTADAAP